MVMGRQKKIIPTIYIQIASYRDPELLNTLKDCINNAERPEQLRFGIGWQHSPYESWDTLDEYKDDTRFRIIDIDYRDAKGPCWIRHQLNELYSGETYTLQLDSHHRFAEHWDTTLITMLESLRSPQCKKPMLTSYLPSFDPKNDPASRLEAPWVMEFDRFAPEGPVHFLPHTIDDYKERTLPVPTRFASGHFIFVDGKFCQEVPYDPTYYFHGEEINLSVRAYMAGYDLYAPHKSVIWHEYIREGKKKHWDDHTNWAELDKQSHKHNRELLGIDDPKSSKLLKKNTRTLKEYEQYAGLEFSTRRVHKHTLEKKVPPVSLDDVSHVNGLTRYHKMCIDVYRPTFTETDYTFWAVALEDKNGNEIYRQDANKEEVQQMLSVSVEADKFVHVWRNFYSEESPVKWVIWPHSESKGWLDRIVGNFSI
jgi:hypothetical protein